MDFVAVPIDMIDEPNTFAVLPDDRWVITSPNTQELWFSIEQVDTLGQRRYVPASGAVLEVIFQRRDKVETQGIRRNILEATTQTVTKTATASTDDKSMYKFSLTASDVDAILGGTVKYKLTEGATTTQWVQNWAIQKKLTDPGF